MGAQLNSTALILRRQHHQRTVATTGIGIPQEDITKVFNRFYRVDKARSRAKGGTGLGLSIVRDCVRRYGGWVTAAANSPNGSVFTVGFPRYEPEQEVEE